MSDTTVDRANKTGNYDFDPCVEINQGEASSGLRAGFDGLLQDAPGCSTSIVNVVTAIDSSDESHPSRCSSEL